MTGNDADGAPTGAAQATWIVAFGARGAGPPSCRIAVARTCCNDAPERCVAGTMPGRQGYAGAIRRCLIRRRSAANGPSPTAHVSTIGRIASGNSPTDER